MATFTPRVGLGRPLTYEEADENFEFVEEKAQEASNSAAQADGAAQAANSAANFAGSWSALTGPLTVPSSAYHDGKFWILLNNIADVTAHEPGVSASWALAIGGGDVTLTGTQTLTNKTLGAGTKESVSTGGTITINDAAAPFQHITLTANRTASISLSNGVSRTLWINPVTYTVTWPASIQWVGGEAPDLTANKWSLIEFVKSPLTSGVMYAAGVVLEMP